MKTSIYDNALFFWPEDKGLQGITALHADDFIFGGNKAFYQKSLILQTASKQSMSTVVLVMKKSLCSNTLVLAPNSI